MVDRRKIGHAGQVCSAVRSLVTDGRAQGARLVHVANDRLHFVLAESNALDVLQLWHEGMNVGFLSRNGLYTGAGDFAQKFPAGFLYTCGLDATGVVEGRPVHGRLHSVPAEIREMRCDEAGVRIVGEMRDTALFGSDFRVTRTIETAAFSSRIEVTDTIENRAFRERPYAMLYHVNVGWPLVDVGAVVEADVVETLSRTPWSEAHRSSAFRVEPACDGMDEFCYFHTPRTPHAAVVNGALKCRLDIAWSLETLPKLVEWKSRASGDYVIGLEPCTCWLDGHYSPCVLQPGETVTNALAFEVSTC